MALDSLGPLEALTELLKDQDGIKGVYTGVPQYPAAGRLCAYVGLAGQSVSRPTLRKRLERRANYFVGLVYRVAEAEAKAEQTLAAVLDALVMAFYADTTLGGTAADATLDLTLADRPEYADLVGQEYRTFPVMVTVTQYATTEETT